MKISDSMINFAKMTKKNLFSKIRINNIIKSKADREPKIVGLLISFPFSFCFKGGILSPRLKIIEKMKGFYDD